jgi:hypothetical protein
MRFSISPAEHDVLDALDDESLVKLVRGSLAEHRASGASDDLEQADPSSAAHGGRSTPSLETVGSRNANTAQDSAARAAHRRAANDIGLTPADRAAHRLAAGIAGDYEAQSRRDAAHAKVVPGIDRL